MPTDREPGEARVTGIPRRTAPSAAARALDLALFAAAAVGGALIRTVPVWSAVFPGGPVQFLVADPYYHMRRIQYAVRHFPTILEFDPFVNFPDGAPIYWPQGFDLMLAAAARFLVPDASTPGVERLCALAIPFLGVAAVLAVYALARAALAAPAAGAAALTYAFLPFPVAYGLLGYVDHHVVEPVFLAAAGALWAAALSRRGALAAAGGCAAGIIASLSNAFVTDGVGIVALLCVFATFEALRGAHPGARPAGLAVVLAAAAAILPLAALTPWGKTGTYTYLTLSPFHSHLALAGAGLASAAILAAWRGAAPAARALGALAGLGLAAAALLHGGRELLAPVREALSFLGRTEAIAAAIGESRPTWRQPPAVLLGILSPLGLAAPILLAVAALRDRARPAGAAALLALGAWGMGAVQARFLVLGGVGTAYAAGWLIERVWAATARSPRAVAFRAAAIVVLAGSLAVPHSMNPIRGESSIPDRDARDLARALAGRSDPGADPIRAGARPRWGVLGTGDLGHLLIYRGKVAVISTPFGQASWHIEGVKRAIRFTLTESDLAAADLARRLRVRYVYTIDPFTNVREDARVMQVPFEIYGTPVGDSGAWRPTPIFLRTVRFRLHTLDGSGVRMPEQRLSALPSFRLVWESEGGLGGGPAGPGGAPGAPTPRYKLFEVVPGARLEGACAPGETVNLAVSVRTNTGRAFAWRDETRCSPGGRYALRTPYALPARLAQGSRAAQARVTEREVLDAGSVRADLVVP
jgi:dolichyl-diphosphooligosaccharide--protein glycosyltransferase